MTAGDFDLAMAGWGPDYDDPLTFADLFTSWNKNNRGAYSNPELDALVAQIKVEMNAEKRLALIRRAFPDRPPRLLDPFMGGGATGLEALGLGHVPSAGLAKQYEQIFSREGEPPIALPDDSPALKVFIVRAAVRSLRHSATSPVPLHQPV